MNVNGKHCSRCQKFKSADEFYKQGDRLESLCKQCKQESRSKKNSIKQESAVAEVLVPMLPDEIRSYEDFGFTKEEFLEIANFYQELMRLKMLKGANNG